MRVSLRKVTKTPLDFDVKSNEITFKGYLQYHSGRLILLKAHLLGKVEVLCDICAEDFKLDVDEDIEFFISDGLYEDEDNIDLDVVESLNGDVDVEDLLASEIELITSDYHSCKHCKN